MNKPEFIQEDHISFINLDNRPDTHSLVDLYDFFGLKNYHGSSLNKDKITWVCNQLKRVIELQELDLMKEYIGRHTGIIRNLNDELLSLSETMEDILYDNDKQKVNRKEKYDLRKEILSDLMESLITIYSLTKEEEAPEKILSSVRYIAGSVLWLNETYNDLFEGKLTEDEINDLLKAKWSCRSYDVPRHPTKDFLVGQLYKSFAANSSGERKPAHFLYIFGDYSLQYVKIGVTSVSVDSRFEAAQKHFRKMTDSLNNHLYRLKVIETQAAQDLETYLKRKYRAKMIPDFKGTEWFRLNKEDLDYLLNEKFKSDENIMAILNQEESTQRTIHPLAHHDK